MIVEKVGLWERASKKDVDAIVCTTNNVIKNNGELVMGRGIAVQFKETFPNISYRWGRLVEEYAEGGHTDYGILVDGPLRYCHNQLYLVGVQTKRNWSEPSPIELIEYSCRKLLQLSDLLCWTRVICPMFGCGNGNLTWKEVQKKIKFLDDRFIITDIGV
jgi:hypothetical protein